MTIIVVGSGGREHALTWALAGPGRRLICAPGNPGMGDLAELRAVNVSDRKGIVSLALEEKADLVVAGPEAPLVEGLADDLRAAGIHCFGPGKDAARLEGSKWFAKEVMQSAGVPTAEGMVFTDPRRAADYIGRDADDFVIKADGLAAGKGVFLPSDEDEVSSVLEELFSGKFGPSGERVVVERRLRGDEASVLAICSGQDCVLLPPSRDHKRLLDGDRGPNTGGMGAVCPPEGLEEGFMDTVRTRIIKPVLRELSARGIDYRGVLYAGLMLTPDGPKVLEFNVRFGDPETQAVLPLLGSDLAELCLAAACGEPLPGDPDVRPGACACVVMASGGYPSSYGRGYPITGIEEVTDALVFHAGTSMEDGRLVTSGGRVLGVSAVADTLEGSIEKAYEELERIHFENCFYRKDIGK